MAWEAVEGSGVLVVERHALAVKVIGIELSVCGACQAGTGTGTS